MSFLLNWLFGEQKQTTVELVLQPDASGRALHGFSTGAPLTLTGTAGETVGTLMERFNTYRGPDQEIKALRKSDGSPLPFGTPLWSSTTAIVSKK